MPSDNSIRVISRSDVERFLTPDTALRLVDSAMRSVSIGNSRHLTRRILELPVPGAMMGDMPGSLADDAGFGLKTISIFPALPGGRTPHRGFIVVFEPRTGNPVAVVEAGSVTAIRTAAASAHATRLLARDDARSLGILGAGEQAEHHVRALLSSHRFETLTLWARRSEQLGPLHEIASAWKDVKVRRASSPEQAAAEDVVCTVTSASDPILLGRWLKPGQHLNLVGSSFDGPREVDDEVVTRSRYFVDARDSALLHASELRHAIKNGLVTTAHIAGEIGQVAIGSVIGRRSMAEITVYKSLGHIAQDLECAWFLYQRAHSDGFGTRAAF